MTPHEKYAVALAVLAVCILLAVYAWSQLYLVARDRHQSQAARKARGTRAAQATAPVTHVGATEAYGPELRAAGQALPSADLRTTGEQMVADHRELGGIGDALDQFAERTMHELRLFCGDDLELFMRATRWGGAALDDTNTFNRRDLDLAFAGSVTR
jgi:hypothetical protein